MIVANIVNASRRIMEKVGMKYQYNFDYPGRDRVYYSVLRSTNQN
ncbi:MAG: hypothetical protein QQW96_17545 [Tychonema bourrellyi B0820]|nr:hypothetical protein [Tychonema bourrellyi]MDQ2099437.1 hypothetical protein [Tychonema bourrellyi B0820]